MLDLSREYIQQYMEQYRKKFVPKLWEYSILHHKFEDIVQQSTRIWKIIFGLIIDKISQSSEGTSSQVELDNKEDIDEPQTIEEEEGQKVEVSGS